MLWFPFDHPHDHPADELTDRLGGKGAGLALMAGELALPVPPGFTLTTEACDHFRRSGWDETLDQALRSGIDALAQGLGRGFGNADAPLLLSVRSGAAVSMPGMMDTILNVGLDGDATAALSRDDAAFADDCRARLEASWAETMADPLPEDPWAQLRGAVAAVFRSADSARARSYREREGISGPPTTAVNVQAMVFGNRDDHSGTGVVFSRDPASGAPTLYGDILFRAQGEDVVSGRRATRPVAELDERMPEVARSLRDTVARLEHRLRDLCEVEFTIESGRLFVLQVRRGKRTPRAALRIAADLAADPTFPLDRREAVERVHAHLADPPRPQRLIPAQGQALPEPWGRGLGASPGICSGVIQTELPPAIEAASAGLDVILCRPETSPADVEGIQCARGLLTATGGLASHAAVVARGSGIPAVVGLEGLTIDAGGIVLRGRRLAVGDHVTIDGTSGAVFDSVLETSHEIAPEAGRLLKWASELGIALPAANAPTTCEPEAPSGEADARVDDILHTLSIRGSATAPAIAAALGTSDATTTARLEGMESAGLIEPARPIGMTLTALGRDRATRLAETDRQLVGPETAQAALVDFQALDERLKQAVTDWQVRTVGEELVPNDHADAAWDRSVIERLGDVVDDVTPWLGALTKRLPRLARYGERLRVALEFVSAGDARFVASPIVDSLHGVWFELHEDLIRLAGSSRSEELAAGRSG